MRKRHTSFRRSAGRRARPITLTTAECDALREKAASATAPHREVQRARMILLAADDLNNEHVARQVGASSRTVRVWRERFGRCRFDGLRDGHRSGRPGWTQFNERHGNRFHFVYTPIHASWVNQVEVFFGIVERRILKHGDYASRDALIERIGGFLNYWYANEAHALKWTFRGKRWQTQGAGPHSPLAEEPMPAHRADEPSADQLDRMLAAHDGLGHPRVRRRGSLLTIESKPAADAWPHARLRREGVHLWRLKLPAHRGR